MIPESKPMDRLRRMRDTGFTSHNANLEVWDKRLFEALAPGKAHYIGYDTWVRRLVEAVDVMGEGSAMAAVTIDEAVRRLVAVGGSLDHVGGVDNFCWPSVEYDARGNPDGKYKAAQLVRACWALRDLCRAYEIPLLSGKDSMYVDGVLPGPFGETHGVSAPPTLFFTAASLVPDLGRVVTFDLKSPGDLLYLVGETRPELGGSEFYEMLGYVGLSVPQVRPQEFLARYRRHAIVVNVAAGAVLTPTGDPLNLALMAVPMVLFYEIGIVLARNGGALARMLPVFRLGAGGPVGSGRQVMSWIAAVDVAGAIAFALQSDALAGPINLTAPNPVTSAEFARTLGAVLHRPAVLPVPAVAISLAFGEMGRELLLGGARVLPARLTSAGFAFRHPELADALRRRTRMNRR